MRTLSANSSNDCQCRRIPIEVNLSIGTGRIVDQQGRYESITIRTNTPYRPGVVRLAFMLIRVRISAKEKG